MRISCHLPLYLCVSPNRKAFRDSVPLLCADGFFIEKGKIIKKRLSGGQSARGRDCEGKVLYWFDFFFFLLCTVKVELWQC